MRLIVAVVSVLSCGAGITGTLASAESPAETPAAVVESFVSELIAITPKYPELSGWKEYAASRKDKLRIHYEKGFIPFKAKRHVQPAKRYAQPDDFAENGMRLMFSLADDRLGMTPQATATTRHLATFHLSLYADFQLSSAPSAGLREELQKLIAEHVARLEKLNENAATTNAVESTSAPAGARGAP